MSDDLNGTAPKIIEPDYFSNMVMTQALRTKESLLETISEVASELDIEEEKVKRLITPPLMSRLEAECADVNLLKHRPKSKKLI